MATCDIIYGFFNLATQPNTELSSTSENTFYPATNTKDPRSTKVFRSTAASDGIVFDMKTSEEVDLICIRPDLENGWGFSGDITIEANITSNFTSPMYSTTLTVNHSENFAHIALPSSESYRFWKISGTSSSYFELSNVFIGLKYQAERNASLNWNYSEDDLSKVKRNLSGQAFIDEYGTQKNIDFNVKVLTTDGMEAFENNYQLIGKKKPLWLIMDNESKFSNSEIFSGLFYITKSFRYRNVAFGYFDTSVGLKEAK